MKNIAIVINTSWNIYNFRIELLLKLKEQGYNIFCVAPKDAYSVKLEEYGFTYCKIEMNNKGSNPIEDIKLIYQLYTVFKTHKIDLALLYTIKPNIYGNIAAKLSTTLTLSTVTGLGTIFLNSGLTSFVAKKLFESSRKNSQ
jgi:hypothetical protein